MFQNQINLYRKVSLISYLPAWLEIEGCLIQFDTRPMPFEKPEIHGYVAIASTISDG
jgi:hypothetical protein